LHLARHFGTSADFWMNIQKDYELVLARQKSFCATASHGQNRIYFWFSK